MTTGEREALNHLDWLCWQDAEAGGTGWVKIAHFATTYGVGYNWASQLLHRLELQGLAESRIGRPKAYALTEKGAEVANPAGNPLHGTGKKRGEQ